MQSSVWNPRRTLRPRHEGDKAGASLRAPGLRTVPVLSIACVLAGVVFAQQNSSAPPPPSSGAAIDAASVEQEIKRLTDSSALDESLKTKVLALYEEALGDLRLAEQWATRGATFVQAMEEAPARLKALREELARPQVDVKPEAPAGASLPDLELIVTQQQAALKSARDELESVDKDRIERKDRAPRIQEDLVKARQELEVVRTAPASTPPDEPAALTRARQLRQQARQKLLEEQVAALEKEGPSYAARGDLLTARADSAARKIQQAEASLKAWQEFVNRFRQEEAEQAARAALQKQMEAARKHPIVQPLADHNAQLAERRKDIAARIESATGVLNRVSNDLKRYTDELAGITKKVKAVGLTPDLGQYLRRQRASLPRVKPHRDAVTLRERENAAVLVESYTLEDERVALRDLDARIAELTAGLEAPLPKRELADIRTAARELLADRLGLLDDLLKDSTSYSELLSVQLNPTQRLLISKLEEYSDFIDRRVLWVRSTGWPALSDVRTAWMAIWDITLPERWRGLVKNFQTAVRREPEAVGNATGAAIVLLILLLLRRPLVRRLRACGEEAQRRGQTSFAPTLRALLFTIPLAATEAMILWCAACALEIVPELNQYTSATAYALKRTAFVMAALELFRNLCRPDGLGELHFDWPVRALRVARRQIFWLKLLWIPLLWVNATVDRIDDDAWQSALGRLSFILRQAIFAVLIYRVFRRRGGVLQESLAARAATWPVRLYRIWFPLVVALPLLMAALAIPGYYYTAMHLTPRFVFTLPMALTLVLINALAVRALILSHRKLAMDQARKRRAAMSEAATADAPPPEPEPEQLLTSLSEQTRTMLRLVLSVVFVAGLWFVWVDVLPALRVLDDVVLWSSTVTTTQEVPVPDGSPRLETLTTLEHVTLRHLLVSVVTILLALAAYRNLPGLMELILLQRIPLKPGSRFAITTVTRYIIVVIGVISAFQNVGITWDKYQWLVAALSVGIGFGLQEIVANLISGLIILIERPIRLGDIVTVGNIDGKVTRIQIRATTITDWDHRDLVVPNKEFITGPVVNWTLTDSITRISIPVGVAYGSDTDLARKILEGVARGCAHLLDDPAPSAVFHGFGDSALNLTLRVHVSNRDYWPEIMNELHTNIAGEFRRAGIEIAFPQRDIHIRSIAGPVTLGRDDAAGRPAARKP